MTAATVPAPEHTAMGRLLDVIERAGNKVPHPVMMFLYLIIGVIVLSAVLALAGVSVTDEIVVPDAASRSTPNYYEDTTQPILEPDVPRLDYEDDFHLEEVTIPIKSLLDAEGIRFIFTSFVPNFAGFGVVAVTFVALMGAGVAEASGLMAALIRLLVGASPRRLLAFVLIFVGVLSSIATDAGYLILVPLGRGGVRERRPAPAGRHGRLLRRRRRDLRRQPDPRPDRRPDHRDHQRGARRGRWRAAHDPRELLVQHRLVDPAGARRRLHHRTDVEPRLGACQPATAGEPGGISIEDDADTVARSGVRAARPALRAHRLRRPSSGSSCCSPCRPARRCATR